jgi:hypothetical protein
MDAAAVALMRPSAVMRESSPSRAASTPSWAIVHFRSLALADQKLMNCLPSVGGWRSEPLLRTGQPWLGH